MRPGDPLDKQVSRSHKGTRAAAAGRTLVRRRHAVVFAVLRPLFRVILWLKYGYHGRRFTQERRGQPYLILANHNGAIDPFMVALSFRQPIYFVASDHIFRLGALSRLIRYLAAPIPIVKSMIDTRAIRDMLTVLRQGGSVGLFPSGNRSFTGLEMPIPASTAKLVKHLRVPVVLYRFDHGYLATPRWARHSRRGRVVGRVERVLEPAEIAALTPAGIHTLLVTSLRGDPPAADQTAIRFRGRRLAEYLERVLTVCPACLGLDTLRSRGDCLRCPCGYTVRYRANGRLERLARGTVRAGHTLPALADVAAFDHFQQQHLATLAHDSSDRHQRMQTPYFADNKQVLVRAERAARTVDKQKGALSLYADRLVFTAADHVQSFPLAQLGDVLVHGSQTLQFHDRKQDAIYEIRSSHPRSAYKYMLMITALRAATRS